MINFNVGGTKYTTSQTTVDGCKELTALVYSKQYQKDDIFLDRDPIVFGKMLKLLRGYDCLEYMWDNDVLCELVFWNHVMLSVEVPDWMKPQPLTVHTLDPQQSELYDKTHGLLTLDAITKLKNMKLIDAAIVTPVCKAVGALQGWVESCWMEHEQLNLATLRYQFQTYFKVRQFSLKK
jgi:hypothetical protein